MTAKNIAHQTREIEIVSASLPTGPLAMSSREIAGLTEKRHSDVIRDIRVLLDVVLPGWEKDDANLRHQGISIDYDNRGYVSEIRLPKDLTITLVAGYDASMRLKIIRRWIDLEAQAQTRIEAPTTAEAFSHAFRMIADAEKRQVEQQRAISALEHKIDRVERSQTIMATRPSNAEGITHIRVRIGRLFGLSAKVIDEVIRQTPYAPKPAGMVRNEHVEADGAPYAVYWKKDVTATFTRFSDECEQVTSFMFTHPYIEGRFRLSRKAVAA